MGTFYHTEKFSIMGSPRSLLTTQSRNWVDWSVHELGYWHFNSETIQYNVYEMKGSNYSPLSGAFYRIYGEESRINSKLRYFRDVDFGGMDVKKVVSKEN